MDRDHNGFLSDFERDADGDGIPNMDESRGPKGDAPGAPYTGAPRPRPAAFNDFGLFTPTTSSAPRAATRDPERVRGHQPGPLLLRRPHDRRREGRHARLALGRLRRRRHPRRRRRRRPRRRLQHRRVPARGQAPSAKDRHYGQLDACYPNVDSAFCLIGSEDIDGDGIPNRYDTDDDGDGLPDAVEQSYGLDSLQADTDGDGVSDGFEYWSALDLNGAAVPFPGKAPVPQRARRQRRRHRLRRRRPHPEDGVPGLELRRAPAAAELQRRQPLHGRRAPCATARRTSTATA